MTKDRKQPRHTATPTVTTDHIPQFIPAETAPLSPQRAFLVQFRLGSGQDAAHFWGRVEHIVSGGTTRFHTPEELLAFIAQILTEKQAG